MKKVIKLTESKLISLIERVLNEGTVLKYSKPIPAEISKSLDKKRNGKSRQNVFKIVTKNTTRYYSIMAPCRLKRYGHPRRVGYPLWIIRVNNLHWTHKSLNI